MIRAVVSRRRRSEMQRAQWSHEVVRGLTVPMMRARTLETWQDVLAAVRRHRLGTHASALAFRVLISLVPLALLGVALLGVLGLESVWNESVSPTLHRHLASAVAAAADDTARSIFERDGAALLALASLTVIRNTFRAMR